MIELTEVKKRMARRSAKKICWTLAHETIEYSYIPATSARNWDGSPAGDGQDPNREILQKIVRRDGSSPRFTNYW